MSNVWVAVDADGSELIFDSKPNRRDNEWVCPATLSWINEPNFIDRPKGSIKALIGRELSWSDEAVELKEPIAPCIDCESAKFADEVIKPSPSLQIYNLLKEVKG